MKPRIHLFSLFFMALLVLAGCMETNTQDKQTRNDVFDPYNQTVMTSPEGEAIDTMYSDNGLFNSKYMHAPLSNNPQQAKKKIGILLPLSGPQASLGQDMLQAAQLALFDMNETAFELIPQDTKGTPHGTTQATHEAVKSGAQMILGPLLASSVEAAGRAARQYNMNVIGFTTDWSKAGNNVMTMGILPFDQGARLAQYVAHRRFKNVAVIAPHDPYADAVLTSFKNGLAEKNKEPRIIIRSSDPQRIMQELQGQEMDALVMAVNAQVMQKLAPVLTQNNYGTNQLSWLGTGLWDTPMSQNSSMAGAYYTAPDPVLRRHFETSYQALYGEKPKRLASLAYDAMALAIVIGKQQGGFESANYQKKMIMNPNGFAGIDGIFRFKMNGLAERGLAIHRVASNGQTIIMDKAPQSFVKQ